MKGGAGVCPAVLLDPRPKTPTTMLSSLGPGGNLGNFKIPLMVSIEVPIHTYISGPQNYNPVRQDKFHGMEA